MSSATGTFVAGDGNSYPQGPGSWLDAHLSTAEMAPFVPGAGQGPKITAMFKAKVFSFGHIVIDGNKLTHYQISEPLLPTSSASSGNPAPYGLDYYGHAVKDPIPDTVVDPATGQIVAMTPDGTPDLLDKWTIEKPDLEDAVTARLAPSSGNNNYRVTVANKSRYALNGAQIVLNLSEATTYKGPIDDTHTVFDNRLIVTIGHIDQGNVVSVDLPLEGHGELQGKLRSATALPVKLDRSEGERE